METNSKLQKVISFIKDNIFVFAFYLILFGYFFLLFHQISSLYLDFDIDEYVLRADAFFHGDILLHHYMLTTETFMFTVNPWFYLSYLFFGVSFESKILGSTFMIFSSIMCATLLISQKKKGFSIVDLLFFLFVAGFPRLDTYWMPFGHITIYGIAFVVFYFFTKLLKNEHKILSTAMVALFLFMGIMSDKIAFIAIIFPLGVILIRQLFPIVKTDKDRYKHILYVGIVVVGAVIVASVTRIIYTKFIAMIDSSSDALYGVGFSLKGFGEALEFTPVYIESVERLYGINFKSGDWMFAVSIFQIIGISLASISIIYQTINFFLGKKRDIESELLSISLLAMMIVTYCLKISFTVYAARYFCGMPMITALVTIRTRRLLLEQYDVKFNYSENIKIKYSQIGGQLLIGLSIIPLMLGQVYFENKQTEPIQSYLACGAEIKSLGLQYGFTHIHTGNPITVANHKEIDLIYIEKKEDNFKIQQWGIQEERITYERNFVLLWYSDFTVLNRDDVINSFGVPTKEILREEYAIMVYDYNIATKVVYD